MLNIDKNCANFAVFSFTMQCYA